MHYGVSSSKQSTFHLFIKKEYWKYQLNPKQRHFLKLSLLRAYISSNNFNILCLLETYLDSSIVSNDFFLINFFYWIHIYFVVKFGNGIWCTFLNTQKLSSSIICEKFNLKTYYPPFMNGEFGIIKKQTLEIIRKAINQFSWVMRFTDIDVND